MVITIAANIAETAILTYPACFPDSVVGFIADKQRADVRFVEYLFRHLRRQIQHENVGTGSVQDNINLQTLARLTLRVPEPHEQSRIAHILGTLDDKIENNRKTAKTLEAMAQAIFKSWFVDFDPVRAKMAGESTESICKRLKLTPEILDLFPDRLVDSELGEIPEGWGIRSLGELVNIIKGRSYKSEELSESETALVTLKSFARGGGYRVDGLKPFTGTYKPEQLLRSGDMLIACTDVTQAAEVIGRPIIIRENARYRNLVASLDTIIVRPLNPSLNPTYLYYLCATDVFTSHTSTYATGTTVLHLSKEAIPSFRLPFATHSLIDLFQRKALPLLKRNEVIDTENEQLVSIRDTLLPKLISGEIRVPEAEHLIEKAAV
jgi:type I restriction enzyme S subunit